MTEICKIINCSLPVKVHKLMLCNKHSKQFYRNKDKAAKIFIKNTECKIEGCHRKAMIRYLCHTHYAAWYKRNYEGNDIHRVTHNLDKITKLSTPCGKMIRESKEKGRECRKCCIDKYEWYSVCLSNSANLDFLSWGITSA